MPYRHLVLDLDGTLVDTLADIHQAMNTAITRHGYAAIPMAQTRRLVGRGARKLIQDALGETGAPHLEAVLEMFLEEYHANPAPYSKPYPGMMDLLQKAGDRGLTISLLSNKPESLARLVLDAVHMRPFFSHLIGGETLPVKKPDPAGVVHLMKAAHTAREETMMIGDTRIDMDAASRAQVTSCGVLWGFDPEGVKAAKPDYLIAHARQLRDILGL